MHKPLWAAAAWRNRLNWKPTAYSNLAIDWEANLGPNLWRACKVQDHFPNLLFTDPTPTWAWKPCVLTLRTVGIISGCLMEFNKNFLRNHTRGYEGEQDGGPAKNGTGTSSGKQEFMVLRLWTECNSVLRAVSIASISWRFHGGKWDCFSTSDGGEWWKMVGIDEIMLAQVQMLRRSQGREEEGIEMERQRKKPQKLNI